MTELTKSNDIPVAAVKTSSEFVIGLIAGGTVCSAGISLLWTVLFANALFGSFSKTYEWKCSSERLQGQLDGESRVNNYLLNENDRLVKRWANAPPAPRCYPNFIEQVPEPPIP
jgi:hypothetical protein